MMSGVPLETCWACNKLWNNKFYYKAASCWYFYWVIYDARIHEYQIHKQQFTPESMKVAKHISACRSGISVCVKCEADSLKNPMTFMLSYVQIWYISLCQVWGRLLEESNDFHVLLCPDLVYQSVSSVRQTPWRIQWLSCSLMSRSGISVCVKCEADSLKNPMTFMLSYVQIGQEHQTHTQCISALRSCVHWRTEGVL